MVTDRSWISQNDSEHGVKEHCGGVKCLTPVGNLSQANVRMVRFIWVPQPYPTGQSILNLEIIIPYVTAPWWIPPMFQIAQNKDEGKKQHDNAILPRNPRQLCVYTDGSGINGKIGASAAAPSTGVTRQIFLGRSSCYTVYSGELQGIAMALSIAKNRPTDSIQLFTIFTDNQTAIRSSCNPSGQSGQQIL